MIYSFGKSPKLSFHGENAGSFSVNLVEGFKGNTKTNLFKFKVLMTRLHAIFFFTSWGILADLGIIATLYFKATRFYRIFHISIFIFITLCTIFFETALLILSNF